MQEKILYFIIAAEDPEGVMTIAMQKQEKVICNADVETMAG